MAKPRRRAPARSNSRSSPIFTMLAGLLIGLVVAAVVAFYVTQAPVPFVDRATREPSQNNRPPDPRQAPDPNSGLYGRDGAAGLPHSGPTADQPAPPPIGGQPATPPSAQPDDAVGALIASLPQQSAATQQVPRQNTPSSAAAGTIQPAAQATDRPAAPPAASSAPAAAASGSYFLQVGAFRVAEDAENRRVEMLLLGLPAEIQKADVNGVLVNRVRVGPFERLDDMNRTRARLAADNITSTVVRQ